MRSPDALRSNAADAAACRATLRHNSRTFFAASVLLPRKVREPAAVLYRFCRLADDAVDLHGGALQAVAQLRQQLDRAYAGAPLDVEAERALATMLARFAIPRELPDRLLEGLRWDAEGRRYDTLPELYDYAARVAGTVGAMMALLMGVRSPAALARACDLGVAMQLSNIARDVGEDARAGRLYLPQRWLREAGVDPDAWLAQPGYGPELRGVVQRLLAAADTLYRRVDAGVALLPLSCRPGINAARYLYAGIGHQVRRTGHDPVQRRAVVPAARKAWLLACAGLTLWPSAHAANQPALAATQMLVNAAAASRPLPEPAVDKLAFVIDLFERLERRDQLARRGVA